MVQDPENRHASSVPVKGRTARRRRLKKIYRTFIAHISPIQTNMQNCMADIYDLRNALITQ
jgi:hypothetical protein